MVAHRSERNEICFVCGAKFKSKLSLYKHKIIHENNFVFCSICNARFKSKYDCNYHERVKHLGQAVQRKNPNQTFSCDECNNVYKKKDVSIKCAFNTELIHFLFSFLWVVIKTSHNSSAQKRQGFCLLGRGLYSTIWFS